MRSCSFSQLLVIFAISICISTANIIWINRSLDNEVGHPAIEDELVNWGSANVIDFDGQKSVNMKFAQKDFVQRTFQINIPHAYVIVQAQIVQIGCLGLEEGFGLNLSNFPGTIERFNSAIEVENCSLGHANTYVQRFTIPQTEDYITVKFSTVLNSDDSNKSVSFNNFRLGINACNPDCGKCSSSNSIENPDLIICDQCPANAHFVGESNSCACDDKFKADLSSGFLVCKEDTTVDDGAISTACKIELNNYSKRTRVNFITTEQDGVALAHVDSFHFYSAVSAQCASLIRQVIVKYDNESSSFLPLDSTYIKGQVLGDYIDVGIPLEKFTNLANTVNTEGDKKIYTIKLALQFKIGSVISRTHEFDLIYQVNGDQTHTIQSFNQDYQQNMNFIAPLTFSNTDSFIKEYLFDIKRYLCVDQTCVLSREFQGFSFHEEIIVKIQFKSNQNKQHLSLLNANIFGNNQEFDVLSGVTVITSGDGFLILSLHQDFIATLVDNQQATNKAYLQFTVTYHDNASDVTSKLRYGQAVILFYALFTAQS